MSASFPTADRRNARRAHLDALRATDGLPPITGRPVTSTVAPLMAVSVSVAVTVAPPGYLGQPMSAGPVPPVAPNAVVSFNVFFLPFCHVLTCFLVVYLRTYLRYRYTYVHICGILT